LSEVETNGGGIFICVNHLTLAQAKPSRAALSSIYSTLEIINFKISLSFGIKQDMIEAP
jgi:hypothetical protein